jgi:hypothetical protein
MTRPCALLGIAALVALLATPAQATPIVEQTLVATGGDVVVTFVSNAAGYTSELFLDGPLGDELGAIFNNWTTELGSSLNLGSFGAGTELVFKLLVQQSGDVFYTGNVNRNADGVVHAIAEYVDGRAIIGFEDLYGGGDLDYNDLVFSFANVAPLSGDHNGLIIPDSSADTGAPPGAPGAVSGAGGGGPDTGALPGTGGSGALPDAGAVPGTSGGHPDSETLPDAGSAPPATGVTIGGGTAGGSHASDGPLAGGPAPLTVDEPSNLLLLGTGLLMLVFAMKRQSVRR